MGEEVGEGEGEGEAEEEGNGVCMGTNRGVHEGEGKVAE